jgi:pilus assembly protein CpaE
MKAQTIKVSVLNGSQSADPALQETLQGFDNLRLLQGAEDPEAFLALHQEKPPDLVLVELNGRGTIPGWLEPLIERLPRSEVLVCSSSRDPDFLIKVMKLRAGGFIPLPLNREDFLATLKRLSLKAGTPVDTALGQVLTVCGARGGVGTTSVATNLSVALAEFLEEGVALVDLARPLPQVGEFLDLRAAHTIMDLIESADSLDPMFMQKVVQKHKSGLEVLIGQPSYHLHAHTFADLPDLRKIWPVLRSVYTWVVVDLGAWLDMANIRVLQESDQVLLVTELTVPDLQNLKFLKGMWRDWGIDDSKVKILVNHYAKKFSLKLKDLENFCYQPAFVTLPHDYPALVEAINQGVALGELAPRSRLWRGLQDLAASLETERQSHADKPGKNRTGLLRRLFH